MSKVSYIRPNEKLLEEAAVWLVLLDEDGPLDADDETAFRIWVRQSPQNIDALEEVAALWGKQDVLRGMAELFPLYEKSHTQRFGFQRGLAVATAAMLLVVSFTFIYSITSFERAQTYTTAIGQRQTIEMEDGSLVVANTDSELSIKTDESERSVILERGEVFFEVESDPTRPFVVHAGDYIVRAVGTAFSVYVGDDSLEVTVSEGVVEILGLNPKQAAKAKRSADDQPLVLKAGQVAAYSGGIGTVETIEPNVVARKLLWQQGMLAFDGETLEQVVEEFSRYTTMKIEFADDAAKGIMVGGYFRADDVAGMLDALQKNFGIDVNHEGTNTILLSLSE